MVKCTRDENESKSHLSHQLTNDQLTLNLVGDYYDQRIAEWGVIGSIRTAMILR